MINHPFWATQNNLLSKGFKNIYINEMPWLHLVILSVHLLFRCNFLMIWLAWYNPVVVGTSPVYQRCGDSSGWQQVSPGPVMGLLVHWQSSRPMRGLKIDHVTSFRPITMLYSLSARGRWLLWLAASVTRSCNWIIGTNTGRHPETILGKTCCTHVTSF